MCDKRCKMLEDALVECKNKYEQSLIEGERKGVDF